MLFIFTFRINKKYFQEENYILDFYIESLDQIYNNEQNNCYWKFQY